MISLRDDFAEPDYEAAAARLRESTGIQWTADDAELWAKVFAVLKPPAPESDEWKV